MKYYYLDINGERLFIDLNAYIKFKAGIIDYIACVDIMSCDNVDCSDCPFQGASKISTIEFEELIIPIIEIIK